MCKKWVIAATASVVVLLSSLAYAAREVHTFEVSVDIPTLGFYVIPAEADWIHREQILPWNIHNSTLGGLRKNFDVKHDSSAIEARLEEVPYLSNGRENIYLRVSFAGKELSADPVPVQVVSAAEAMTGARYPLEIQPLIPEGGYKQGTYHGSVHLVFYAAAP